MTKKQIQKRYAHIINDWWEPGGEEFKYDIEINWPYAFNFWGHDTECQTVEHFDTLVEVERAFKNIKKADPKKNCARCRFFKDGKCDR